MRRRGREVKQTSSSVSELLKPPVLLGLIFSLLEQFKKRIYFSVILKGNTAKFTSTRRSTKFT